MSDCPIWTFDGRVNDPEVFDTFVREIFFFLKHLRVGKSHPNKKKKHTFVLFREGKRATLRPEDMTAAICHMQTPGSTQPKSKYPK